MNCLIDTHAFLWYALDHPRLSSTARQTLRDSQNTVMISPASYWELAIKVGLKKYVLSVPYETFWTTSLSASGIRILPIEIRHAAELASLPIHHRDPFDRMIVAQSMAEHLPLISNDFILDAYGIQRIW